MLLRPCFCLKRRDSSRNCRPFVNDWPMNRRQFLSTSIGALAAAGAPRTLLALEADNRYRKQIGLQLYTLRNEIAADTSKTIKAVVDAGYHQGEMFGFPDCQPMIDAAREHGLALHSSHIQWQSITEPEAGGIPFSEILGKAKGIGLSHLVVPYLEDKHRMDLDGYKATAEKLNAAAVEAKNAGIQLAYHNHAFEFEPKEGGKTGFDVFMEEFVPEMLFELDVFWVQVGGHDPSEVLKKLKGRVSQAHLKDLKKGLKVPNFGGLEPDAFEELGDGSIPMEPIIAACESAGVVHCHVEQDQSPHPIASIRQSMAYLKAL